MSSGFKSENFLFCMTALGAALVSAGLINKPSMTREPLKEGLLRDRDDRANVRPSHHVIFSMPEPEKVERKVA